MPTRWDGEQRELLLKLWKKPKSFNEIASAVNDLNRLRAKQNGFDIIPHRTARAVAIQCQKLGLISVQERVEWEEKEVETRKKARANNRYPIRKEVFARDLNMCVVCKVNKNLEFAHIIPFEETRRNCAKEAVTLCKNHHKHFDKGCAKCVEKVYNRMCDCYQDYSNEYKIEKSRCGHCRIIYKN